MDVPTAIIINNAHSLPVCLETQLTGMALFLYRSPQVHIHLLIHI